MAVLCTEAVRSFIGGSTVYAELLSFSVYCASDYFTRVLRDDLDRKLQAQHTAEILAGSTHPIVMLSYITNRHGSRDYMKITNDGNVKVHNTMKFPESSDHVSPMQNSAGY